MRWSRPFGQSFVTPGSNRVRGGARCGEPHPLADLNGRPLLVAVAARVGKARLIDNVVITPDRGGQPDQEALL